MAHNSFRLSEFYQEGGEQMIEFINVDFRYPNGFHALQRVQTCVEQGSITAIIGPNGSGKSTFIKQINGLLNPSKGQVLINGIIVASQPLSFWAKSVGFLFQDPNHQIFNHTIIDETLFGPRHIGMEENQAYLNATESLKQVGLENFKSHHPYDLTLPQRKLVALAGILSMEPNILIMDEPTMGQDAEGIKRIRMIIQKHANNGGTVLMVSHDMDFVADSCDHITVMNQGHILAHDRVSKIFDDRTIMKQVEIQPPDIEAFSKGCGLGSGTYTASEFVRRVNTHTANRGGVVR